MKRTLLIIYPYEWLAYAPTVIRLSEALSEHFDVRIIAYEGGAFCPEKVETPGVEYIKLPALISKITERLKQRFPALDRRWHFFHIARALHLIWTLRGQQADEVFGSDYSGMWVAQRVFKRKQTRLHFLSLEIFDSDVFSHWIDVSRIASAIVQSQVRFEWLFPRQKPPVFYIQNAPTFAGPPSPVTKYRDEGVADLVYCGTVLPSFGILRLMEFLRAFPGFTLTIRGLVNVSSRFALSPYADLVEAGRVRFAEEYLPPERLLSWLASFDAGFCIYDFDYLPEDRFNYRTVPSGKLFTYLAAGVPVVGSDIPGLDMVREFEAGVLVDDPTPEALARAVHTILQDHERYRANCLRAAAHFSFDKAVKPLAAFLTGAESQHLPEAISMASPSTALLQF